MRWRPAWSTRPGSETAWVRNDSRRCAATTNPLQRWRLWFRPRMWPKRFTTWVRRRPRPPAKCMWSTAVGVSASCSGNKARGLLALISLWGTTSETFMQGRFEKRGDIGIIWVNNPPVNAISVGVRVAIIDGVAKLAQDPQIKAGILACEGRTFMAGA